MQKILKDLYGNVEFEKELPDPARAERDQSLLLDLEQTIIGRLGEDGAKLMQRYDAKCDEVHGHERAEAFAQGFRFGARLMAAALDDEYL